MPEISRFYGIVIRLYFADHNPPHFHAFYGDEMVEIDIQRKSVMAGNLTPRASGLVLEWTALHQAEMLELFVRAQQGLPLRKIDPLP
jgi:hypothetical protein